MSIFPWGLLFKGLALLAFILFCWWAWDHYVATPYIEKGRAEIQPLLDEAVVANKALKGDVVVLQAHVAEQNASIEAFVKADAAAEKTRLEAMITAGKREAEHKPQVVQLAAQAATPSPTPDAACAVATKVLEALGLQRNTPEAK
jgi:hypothetical protein